MNVIIVHGGPLTDTPLSLHNLNDLYWQPWVKNELEMHGVTCEIPAMPNPWFPVYEDWKREFEKQMLQKDSILVGHSIGAAFLVRWLSETNKIFNKLILVAPNLRSESSNLAVREFYNYKISTNIIANVSERIVFTSENDDLENIESAKILESTLDCRLINLPSHGHYITADMGTDEFPGLIECILN